MLEARGIEFIRRRNYEVGTVVDFYDPSGHRLMLYEPSVEALGWPSGDVVRATWAGWGCGHSDLIGPPAAAPAAPARLVNTGLAGKPLTYLFMFEDDATQAFRFYQATLGLKAVERVHCCNQACPEDVEGIVKYDVGSVLLSTHHIHESGAVVDDFGQAYSPRAFNPENARGIVSVFEVADLPRVARALQAANVALQRMVRPATGEEVIGFSDPFGHPFYAVQAPPLRASAAPAADPLVAAP
jgi:uncharacterized glyoxalase superfamily protein PhnB